MIARDIFYGNLLRLIGEFTANSASFENYFNRLQNSAREDLLISMSERIDSIRTELQNSYSSYVVHENFADFIVWINDFRASFSDFNLHRLDEIELIVSILVKIEAEVPEEFDLRAEIDTDVFCFEVIEKKLQERHFIYEDSNDLLSSFLLIDISDISSLNEFIANQQMTIQLLIYLLPKIGIESSALVPDQYVLIRSEVQGKPALIRSCVSLHILTTGKYIHTPYEFTNAPTITHSKKIRIGENYQQFNDTLTIISEYNHQRDILDKYMRLYHVVENFMFKYPLVEMERASGGVPFSIRDFQRMYSKVTIHEIDALKDFIKQVFDLDHSQGVKFSRFLFNKWTAIANVPGISIPNINLLLPLLKINKPFVEIIENEFVKFFSQLIYSYRNSLVHNRETEFHLTHDSLLNHGMFRDTARTILEKFLIPSLEEIVFFLIMESNTIVWYDKSKLNLWNE